MEKPDDSGEYPRQDLNFAVRDFLTQEEIGEGDEVEIKIFVTNISNNPIHEYRVEKAVRLAGDERARVVARVERAKVVQAFAHPDQLDRAGRARARSRARRRRAPSRRAWSARRPSPDTASPNRRACWRPFWPVVASTTSSVSCGAPGQPLLDHAPHLRQLLPSGSTACAGGRPCPRRPRPGRAPGRPRSRRRRRPPGRRPSASRRCPPAPARPRSRAARRPPRGTCPRRRARPSARARGACSRACRSWSSCRCR